MGAFERIVAGVDGTDWGFEALRQALVLAPLEDSVIHAVTALDTAAAIHTGVMRAAHFAELLEQEAAGTRDAAEEMIEGRRGCRALVVPGQPVDVLRRERDELAKPVESLVARSRTVDLVVVGSRGLHGVRALGSVSERVAHQAYCTVLVVHEPPARPGA